jgi:hypothetical protein
MASEMLLSLLKAGGLAALAIGVIYLFYKQIIRLPIFPKLRQWQAFSLLCLLAFLTFAIAMTVLWPPQSVVTANKQQAANRLRVVHLHRHPYEVGKSAEIDLGLEYSGNAPVQIQGYYEIGVLPHISDENLTPDKLSKNEDIAWTEFLAGGKTLSEFELTIPSGTYVVTAFGPKLLSDQLASLVNDPSAGLLLMGVLKWTENTIEYETDYCFLIQHDPPVYMLCRQHNGPTEQ